MILDVYRRHAVGRMIAERESAKLATKLFERAIAKEQTDRDHLTIHADHGRADEIVPIAPPSSHSLTNYSPNASSKARQDS